MTQNVTDNNKNMENLKPLDEIVYPEIEPGIISKQMIEKSYLEDGYKGEEARLHQMEPIIYERITTLRLDFQSKFQIFSNLSNFIKLLNKMSLYNYRYSTH